MLPTIAAVLRNYAESQGDMSVRALAKKLGIPTTTFVSWWNGETVPKLLKHRAKLYRLTGHPIFAGGLTKESKERALAPVVNDNSADERVARLVHLIRALTPDLKALILHGSEQSRNAVRTKIGEHKLAEFSVLSRAFASEDSLELIKKSSQLSELAKGGSND